MIHVSDANPDSMKAAIDVLATQIGTKSMVMGDMAELGESESSLHAEVGAYAKQIVWKSFIPWVKTVKWLSIWL